MTVAPNIADAADGPSKTVDARHPHLIFRDVLGSANVAELLQHVALRERNFRPAVVRNRRSGERRVDRGQRDCLVLGDLGPYRQMIETFVNNAMPRLLAELRLNEASVEPREFEICAYGDGGRFGVHVDTNELLDRVRVASCVYYFAASPQRFSGGELRLHGLPTLSAGKPPGAPPFVDIAPETDMLVVFPSWLRHEVLPVRVPSGAWADWRFSINCWLLRRQRGAAPAGH